MKRTADASFDYSFEFRHPRRTAVVLDMNPDALFTGWNTFKGAYNTINVSESYTTRTKKGLGTRISEAGPSGPPRHYHHVAAATSYIERFAVITQTLQSEEARVVVDAADGNQWAPTAAGSSVDKRSRTMADGVASFVVTLQLHQHVLREVFDDPEMTAMQLYNFYWFYIRRCITPMEIKLLLPHEYSCDFGMSVGKQVRDAWSGITPSESVAAFNKEATQIMLARTATVARLKDRGGQLVVVISGNLLTVYGGSATAVAVGVEGGRASLYLEVSSGFHFPTNAGIRAFCHSVLQVAHGPKRILMKNVIRMLSNASRRSSTTIGGLSFNIRAATNDDDDARFMSTQGAVKHYAKFKKQLTAEMGKKFKMLLSSSKIMIQEVAFQNLMS